MDLSVVVPVYNEEDNVAELCARTVTSLAGSSYRYEVLLVDDGSSDKTLPRLIELQKAHSCLRVVQLKRNCGQTAAMKAGIDQARGRVIVTMDGDLQNDPADIPALARKLEEGYELVAGWRRNRKDHLLRRKLPSRAANWIIWKVTGVPIHDNGCSLKAYRADVIKNTPLYSELHRFIPAMVTKAGGRIAEVPVTHHPRLHGESKYGLSRVGKVFLDIIKVKMITAFSERPLHWFSLFSVPCVFASAVATLQFCLSAAANPGNSAGAVSGSIAVLTAYLAFHLLTMGLFAELIVKTGKVYDFRANVLIPAKQSGNARR